MLTYINQYGSEAIIENIQIAMKNEISDDESEDSDTEIVWKKLASDIKRRA
jgi:hypothetical protein